MKESNQQEQKFKILSCVNKLEVTITETFRATGSVGFLGHAVSEGANGRRHGAESVVSGKVWHCVERAVSVRGYEGRGSDTKERRLGGRGDRRKERGYGVETAVSRKRGHGVETVVSGRGWHGVERAVSG